MKVNYSNDPKLIGYNATTDTVTITYEDRDQFREVTKKVMRMKNAAEKQKEEREFHDKMLRKYGKNVAGELLYRLWKATSQEKQQ